jgi:hypothetical protein
MARKNSENETGPAAGLCHPERSRRDLIAIAADVLVRFS